VPNLTLGGMGKRKKWLHDLSQTFTGIRTLEIMIMCQILSIYFTANKAIATKQVGTDI
jgi:hypothetical protein